MKRVNDARHTDGLFSDPLQKMPPVCPDLRGKRPRSSMLMDKSRTLVGKHYDECPGWSLSRTAAKNIGVRVLRVSRLSYEKEAW